MILLWGSVIAALGNDVPQLGMYHHFRNVSSLGMHNYLVIICLFQTALDMFCKETLLKVGA